MQEWYFGFSANLDYKITNNMLWRVEARTLHSKDRIFVRSDGSTADNSLFITTSLSHQFLGILYLPAGKRKFKKFFPR
jgi:hypothetical protein